MTSYHPLRWYPVLWATVLVYGWLATMVWGWQVSWWQILFLALPAVLAGQWVVREFLVLLHCPRWLRRMVMLLPALAVAGILYATVTSRSYLSLALGGHVPSGVREILISEDAWAGDDLVSIYLKCNPKSLQRLLEAPPFGSYSNDSFSYKQTGFEELANRGEVPDARRYFRTDMDEKHGTGWVVTDKDFSFAYIKWGVD